jgi:hypothetical protein
MSRALNIRAVRIIANEKIRFTGRDKSFKASNYVNCAGAMLGC